jgi:hypothetical protein
VDHPVPRAARLAQTLALLALLCSCVGYGLEWYRQRGTCEFGDNSPDTLVVSVLLILLGGGIVGLVALGFAATSSVCHGILASWRALLLAVAAVASAGLLLVFAGGGPGSWFQYCAT